MKNMSKFLSFLLVFLFLFTGVACSNLGTSKKVPIYEGMYIAQTSNVLSKKLNQDDPEISDDDLKEDEIETDIEDLVSIEVEGDETVKYYINPSDVFTIVVKLSNPDNYEIQSFTLNGKKYANYMFKDGSDMETLLLDVTAPNAPGYYDYTIDAIKYIDGTEIKDVDLKGEKTIKAGIKYQNEPTATISNEIISTTSISFDVELNDKNNIIGENEKKVYLSDGEKIINEQELKVGRNHVEFKDLIINKSYQYAVMTAYDLVDGNEVKSRTLVKNTFNTLNAYTFDSVEIGQTNIIFNISKTGNVGEIVSISLHDKDNDYALVKSLEDLNIREFNSLLSNHNYTIKLLYRYMSNNEEIKESELYNFKTLEKVAPIVEFFNVVTSQTSISFDTKCTDIDNLYTFNKVDLYLGDELVKTINDATTKEFTSLLSNNTYTLKLTYSYDLNDGNGVQTKVITTSAKTLAKIAPTVEFIDVTATQTSISFDTTLSDINNLYNFNKIDLYLGDELVKTINDATTKEFTSLLSDNTYTLKLTYSYDLNDGKGVQTKVITTSATTLAKIPPIVEFIDVFVTENSISFDTTLTDANNLYNFNKIDLYLGDELVKTINDATIKEFTSLLSDNTYTLKLTYSYDLNDGKGLQTKVITTSAKTLAKIAPTVEFIDVTATQTSISFDTTLTDANNLYIFNKVDLYLGNELVDTISDVNKKEFTSLLSNNTYTLKLTYSYNLNDGNGVQTKVITTSATTLAKKVPTIEFVDENITSSSLSYKLDVDDFDGVFNLMKVELFKEETLINECSDAFIYFDGLDYYTDYVIKVTYSYDLNDGNGIQETTEELKTKTNPYFKLNSSKIINTSAVSEGEIIYYQATLDNPNGAKFNSVIISGLEYQVDSSSTTTRLFVNITNNGQFAGGNTALTLETIYASLDGKNYEININENNEANVFINGGISLEKVEYVNENYESIDYAFSNETIYVLLTFNNPTGYDIDTVKYRFLDSDYIVSDFTKLDDNRYLFSAASRLQTNVITIEEVQYSNIYLNKTFKCVDTIGSIYIVEEGNIKYISNPNDLLNMNDGYYYELTQNIDLSGIEREGNDFNGVFNGNDYSIQNMSAVTTYKNINVDLGLFNNGTGVIFDLNMQDILFRVTFESTNDNHYEINYGGIIAHAYSSVALKDISIDKNSIVDIKNNSNSDFYVGGFIGHSGYTKLAITNCINSGDVHSDGSDVGGFIGYSNGATLTITNCINNGDINGSSNIGGFVGFSYSSATLTITNCINNGDINGSSDIGGFVGRSDSSILTITNSINSGDVHSDGSDVGGFIGYSNGATLTITNCINNGDINGSSDVGGFVGRSDSSILTITNCINNGDINGSSNVGGLIGYSYDSNVAIINSYTLDKYIIEDSQYNGEICTIEDLNNKEFYINTLGWDENIWNLDNLDIENGLYPTLKN